MKFPSNIAGAITNLDSDWVRYGLPAVFLTIIFFFAIRFEDQAEPPPAPPRVAAERPSRPPPFSAAQPKVAILEDHPQMPPGNPAQSMAPRNMAMTHPVAPQTAHPFGQLPASAIADPKTEGRRAVCIAIQRSLVSVRRRHRKGRALELAKGIYRGTGGPEAADEEVNTALSEYARGLWSEAQCPPTPGVPALPKGAIADVMR